MNQPGHIDSDTPPRAFFSHEKEILQVFIDVTSPPPEKISGDVTWFFSLKLSWVKELKLDPKKSEFATWLMEYTTTDTQHKLTNSSETKRCTPVVWEQPYLWAQTKQRRNLLKKSTSQVIYTTWHKKSTEGDFAREALIHATHSTTRYFSGAMWSTLHICHYADGVWTPYSTSDRESWSRWTWFRPSLRDTAIEYILRCFFV